MECDSVVRLHPAWNFVANPHEAELWDLRDGSRVRITAPGGLQDLLGLLERGITTAAWDNATLGARMAREDGRALLDSLVARGIVHASELGAAAPVCKRDEVERGRTDPLQSFFEHYRSESTPGAQLFQRLRSATVLVFGLGGSGTWVAQTLAMLGVGRIKGIDSDVVEASNLGRQALYRPVDLGRPKALVVHEQLAALNPDVEFEPLVTRITAERDFADAITDVDVVALPFAYAGLHPSRDLAARVCVARQVPFLPFGLHGVGPLWRSGSNPCYRCLLPDPRSEGLRSAALGASTARIDELAYLPWLAASANRAADEIVRALTGFLPPLTVGQVLYTNLGGEVEWLRGGRQETCPVCGMCEGDVSDVR